MSRADGVVTGRQPKKVVAMLAHAHRLGGARAGWVCGTEFAAEFMLRYSSVIHTLRHSYGLGVEGRPCTMHEHQVAGTKSGVFMFRLEALPYRVPAHGPGITAAQVHEGEQLSLDEGR